MTDRSPLRATATPRGSRSRSRRPAIDRTRIDISGQPNSLCTVCNIDDRNRRVDQVFDPAIDDIENELSGASSPTGTLNRTRSDQRKRELALGGFGFQSPISFPTLCWRRTMCGDQPQPQTRHEPSCGPRRHRGLIHRDWSLYVDRPHLRPISDTHLVDTPRCEKPYQHREPDEQHRWPDRTSPSTAVAESGSESAALRDLVSARTCQPAANSSWTVAGSDCARTPSHAAIRVIDQRGLGRTPGRNPIQRQGRKRAPRSSDTHRRTTDRSVLQNG